MKAIEQLFRAHYTGMHRQAMLLLRDEEAARDIVHDVFESLLSGAHTEVTAAYLHRAVRNRCLNHIRSLSVRERMRRLYAVDENEIEEDEWPDDATISLIRATVADDLTGSCRRVVDKRFTEGKSYREIAGELGISEVGVYKHLSHAIEILRKKLSING